MTSRFEASEPRVNQIHFHAFRHWRATIEYAKTKDIIHVMNMLGHRNINNTLLYTQLINFGSDEYHSAVAKTWKESRKLMEAGFEYVATQEETLLYRKRKWPEAEKRVYLAVRGTFQLKPTSQTRAFESGNPDPPPFLGNISYNKSVWKASNSRWSL